MKGLIIKDFINLKKQGRVIAILIGFYAVLALTTHDNTMLGGVLAVICAIFPVTAMAYMKKPIGINTPCPCRYQETIWL